MVDEWARSFRCEVCGMTFRSPVDLAAHEWQWSLLDEALKAEGR